MRRLGLVLALFLSLGVNAGILATLGVQRSRARTPPPVAAAGTPALERVADRLRLEGEARRRFLDIQRRFVAETRDARRRLAGARAELRREILAPAAGQAHFDEARDEARVEALLAAIGAATADLDRALVRNVVESRRVLDPDQERRFLRFLALRLRQHRGRGGGA